MIEVSYPETRIDTISDNYHGTVVADPYRWLEDDNSEETKAWVTAQNKVTFAYLDQIPFRKSLRNRLEKLMNFEKFGVPFKEGGKYYYFKNDGLQNQSVLYVADDASSEGKILLDPNTLSKDGTVALGSMDFSADGKYLAYFLNEGGSDWTKAYVMDLAAGKMTSDTLNWIKFSGISWKGNGFYYSRYPEPKGASALSGKNEFHALYYHEIGTPQSADKLIYVDKTQGQRNVYAQTTEDEQYLIISTTESTSGNTVWLQDLTKPQSPIVKVVDNFDNDHSIVDHLGGGNFLMMTNMGAPKRKLVGFNISNPMPEQWKDVIAEDKDPLDNVSLCGGKVFANYMHNASTGVRIYKEDGTFIQNLSLPGIGTAGSISGKRKEAKAYYSFTSFIRPTTIYELDVPSLDSKVFRSPKVDFDFDKYETVQEWYTSKDGTKIPIFITKKKGLKMDGSNVTLLYGYGGFDVSLTPSFSVSRLPILEQGGVYALANIRGGGEFGKDWHKAGTLEQKQNVFDDFIAAGEYLIQQKYTQKEKLAIQGGSNGGLLVGACMTQRPDLFAVAFPAVGVLDMLRYHQFTIGWAWATDYGRSDDPKMFPYLLKYSPYHNTKKQSYPATLITTADHDDRVVPAHSFKFAAALQAAQQAKKPTLIRIDVSAGHGAGKPTSKMIDESADLLSFLFYNTNTSYKDNDH
ncbi:MAG: S9 family peptidase [Saprospiraceae bacterium]|nr:S9 family peptidase [Saprospiraceae bacterium]